MPRLRVGQALTGTTPGVICRVESLIGEGGQGEVYRVRLGAQVFALKWYHERILIIDTRLKKRLLDAVESRAPSDKFLWPFELVSLPSGAGLGYLMPLRGERFESVHRVIGDALPTPPPFRVLALTCLNLADGLMQLHTRGRCYQDINADNVFFDPHSGEVQICDNDNVDIDGSPSVMLGKVEYQAPEIVRRETGPNRFTDLHSLAVLFFRMLFLGHPLLGARELSIRNLNDLDVQRRLYGTAPLFVFDPKDDSNVPLADRHGPMIAHWGVYPQFLRERFSESFTVGLQDPERRVTESVWRRTLAQFHDSIFECAHCERENFYDPRRHAEATPCWSCAQPLAPPPRIGIRRAGRVNEPPQHVVALGRSAKLYPHHFGVGSADTGRPYDFSRPIALVDGEPPTLRNLSDQRWQVSYADGRELTVGAGESASIEPRMRILAGRAEGEIKMGS